MTSTTAIGMGTVQAADEAIAISCHVAQPSRAGVAVVPASPPALAAGRSAIVACPPGDLRPGSRYSYVLTVRSSTEVVTSNRVALTTSGRSPNHIAPPKRIKSRGVTVLLASGQFTSTGAPIRVSVRSSSPSGRARIEVRTDASGRVSVRTFDDPMTVTVTYSATNPSWRMVRAYRL